MKRALFAAALTCGALTVCLAVALRRRSPPATALDRRVTSLSRRYSRDAHSLLRELLSVPAPSGGEGARVALLRRRLTDTGAVLCAGDARIDEFGNLVWVISDPEDATPLSARRAIYVCARADGGAQQLLGLAAQVYASRILLETRRCGSLRGACVVFCAAVSCGANAGGSLVRWMRSDLRRHEVPDCVVLSACTGDAARGACCICAGQCGVCRVRVRVAPQRRSALSALEHGSRIIAAARALRCTAVSARAAHPREYAFELERRYGADGGAAQAVGEIRALRAVCDAVRDGCAVDVFVPQCTGRSYTGARADNPRDYACWATGDGSAAVRAAADAYRRCVSPEIDGRAAGLRARPMISSWGCATDGAAFVLRRDEIRFDIGGKNWVVNGEFAHPQMFGIGAGSQECACGEGEAIWKKQLWCPIAVISRFPSLFVEHSQ